MGRFRKAIAVIVAALLVAGAASAASPHHYDPVRDGPKNDGSEFPPIVDFVLTRPFGVGCIAAGGVLFVALSPFSFLADLARPGYPQLKATSRLFTDPLRYTFLDPLGSH